MLADLGEEEINERMMVGDAFRNYMKCSLDFPISDAVLALCDQFKAIIAKEKHPLMRLGRKTEIPYFIELNEKITEIVWDLDR